MSRRKPLVCAVIAASALTTIAAAPATAATAPRQATLTAVGGVEFVPNRHIQDNMRFNRDRVVIRSGGTLTVRNRTDAPHTISLVKASDVPRNLRQMEACFEGACGELMAAHGVSETQPEPTNPLVNVGATGLDRAGDSALFMEDPLRLKVTAKAGRSLSYICLIHPWMQGRIAVR